MLVETEISLGEAQLRNLFHVHTDDNNKGRDLLLINPPGFSNNRVAIDVSMTHCIPKFTTRTQAANFHKDSAASKLAEKEKNNFFVQIAN